MGLALARIYGVGLTVTLIWDGISSHTSIEWDWLEHLYVVGLALTLVWTGVSSNIVVV